jgi:hypothetical protein
MPKNESVDFFFRFLEERLLIFKRSLEDLKETLVKNKADDKIAACKSTLSAINSLKEAMCSRDHPSWIGKTETAIKRFMERHGHYADEGKVFFNAIVACSLDIENQKWEFSESSEHAPVDFDGYFKKFYDESRLTELFDKLVFQLQTIVESGHVDSVHALTRLQKLINTIKHNTRGSFFSVRATLDFAISLLKNLVLEYIGTIPYNQRNIASHPKNN